MSNPNRPSDTDARDEFTVLRDLWNNAQPTIERGVELEKEDARTRACVEQIQRAWNTSLAPFSNERTERDLDQFRREAKQLLRPHQALPTMQWVALAAAAGLLFAIALGLRANVQHQEQSTDIAVHSPNEDRSEDFDEVSDLENPNLIADAGTESRSDVQVEITEDDRIVLRSGSVRLYLPTASSTSGEIDSIITNPSNTETNSR